MLDVIRTALNSVLSAFFVTSKFIFGGDVVTDDPGSKSDQRCSAESRAELHSKELNIIWGFEQNRIPVCVLCIGTLGGCGLEGCWC